MDAELMLLLTIKIYAPVAMGLDLPIYFEKAVAVDPKACMQLNRGKQERVNFSE